MKKNNAYTLGSLIILLICAFVFVLLPALTGRGQSNDIPVFGKYKNKEIRYEQGSDFADLVSTYAQNIRSYGQEIDSSTNYTIFYYAFNNTLFQYAYEDFVRASGYVVPKSELNAMMRTAGEFRDENGNYSSKLYRQASDAVKKEIRDKATKSLVAGRFTDDLFGSETALVGTDSLYGIKEASAELDFLAALNSTKRGFNMLAFALSDFPEEEKLKFAQENAAKFSTYTLSAITVEDKATAEKVAKRLAKEEITFEDAVSEYSDKAYTNTEGKLSYTYQYQIENILSDKADIAVLAALEAEAVSQPIETARGFAVFKADAPVSPADFSDEDTLSTVSTYLSYYETTVIEDYFTKKAEDFTRIARNIGFEAACADIDMENTVLEPFPLNYGNVSIADSVSSTHSALTRAYDNENFLKTAFSLSQNEISAPIVMNGHVVVLQLTEEITADDEDSPAIFSDLEDYDTDAASKVVMDSPNVQNNFDETYRKYFLGY